MQNLKPKHLTYNLDQSTYNLYNDPFNLQHLNADLKPYSLNLSRPIQQMKPFVYFFVILFHQLDSGRHYIWVFYLWHTIFSCTCTFHYWSNEKIDGMCLLNNFVFDASNQLFSRRLQTLIYHSSHLIWFLV